MRRIAIDIARRIDRLTVAPDLEVHMGSGGPACGAHQSDSLPLFDRIGKIIIYSILGVRITPSGHSYFYNYRQTLSELYEVRGLH